MAEGGNHGTDFFQGQVFSGALPQIFTARGRRQQLGPESANPQESPPSPPRQHVSLLRQLVNEPVVVKSLENYIPFLLIAAAKGFLDHATGIFVLTGLLVTFYHANSVLKREIGRRGQTNIWPILAVLINLLACIIFVHLVFDDSRLYLLSLFIPVNLESVSFVQLLWIVAVNDFVLKFVAIMLKIFVVLSPPSALPHRKRGNYFLFIEVTSQLHRSLVPVQVWMLYLLRGGSAKAVLVGLILTLSYAAAKAKLVVKHLKVWKNAAVGLWMTNARYGTCSDHDELKSAGGGRGTCPICHDDLRDPTTLLCKHTFCEECIATWFDRERTCPVCRARVAEDPAWRDGSTSMFVQLF